MANLRNAIAIASAKSQRSKKAVFRTAVLPLCLVLGGLCAVLHGRSFRGGIPIRSISGCHKRTDTAPDRSHHFSTSHQPILLGASFRGHAKKKPITKVSNTSRHGHDQVSGSPFRRIKLPLISSHGGWGGFELISLRHGDASARAGAVDPLRPPPPQKPL